MVTTSIVMAVFNGQKFLMEQLNSIETQIVRTDQLILVDDCSEDCSLEILRTFANQSSINTMVFSTQRNMGHAAAFEFGLRHAEGDLIFFCDQDDIWFPEKIQEIVSLAQKRIDCLAFTNDVVVTDEYLTPISTSLLHETRKIWPNPTESYFLGCASAVRREVLDFGIPFPKVFNTHDRWLLQLANGLGGRAIHNKTLQYWRRHQTNTSTLFSTGKFPTLQYFKERIRNARLENKIDKEIDEVSSILARIKQLASEKRLGRFAENAENFQSILERKKGFLEYRSGIRKYKPITRVITLAGNMLLRRHKGTGWRSAISDITYINRD